MDKAGFTKPTPIQQKAIPVALDGHDLVASAKTGSGKTASFCLPMIEKLAGRKGTYGLILCPTREIALQTHETIKFFGNPQGVKSAVLIGGVDYKNDVEALSHSPQILVGTPGRICDHLQRGNLWLEYIEIVVLDEADRMLDMGFAKELNKIMGEISDNRQTLLFSATIPSTIEDLARKTLYKPKRIAIGKPLSTTKTIDQEILYVNEWAKKRELLRLIEREKGTIIVFVRSKDRTTNLWRAIHADGIHDSTYISSNKRQIDREEALRGFKEGLYRILFATDVAGRGIHVENVGHVVNFDLPREPEDYIHRIGRTGRKEATGKAISFATPNDHGLIREIERILGRPIPTKRAYDYKAERSGRESRSGSSRHSRSHKKSHPKRSGPRKGRSHRR